MMTRQNNRTPVLLMIKKLQLHDRSLLQVAKSRLGESSKTHRPAPHLKTKKRKERAKRQPAAI
jgi:hypothetical protein